MGILKVGAVTFEHAHDFGGEVDIERGGMSVKVPMTALQAIVAERVRAQMIANIEGLKTHEILALAASKK